MVTTRDDTVGHVATALTRNIPATAVRQGLLVLTYETLRDRGCDCHADALAAAALPLLDALACSDLRCVDAALAATSGRPRRRVMRALTAPELVTALVDGLGELGWSQAATAVAQQWTVTDPALVDGSQPSGDDRWARGEVVSALRTRTGELLTGWREGGMGFAPQMVPPVDGRALSAATRAWQLPLSGGDLLGPPDAAEARHPNRLGRTAAAVAFARLRRAMGARVPDDVLFEAVALLVAVAEAVTGDVDGPADRRAAQRGELCLRVAVGAPVECSARMLEHWWAVLDSWGSTSRRLAVSIPTAWRLSDPQADAVVWALCSAAMRIGAAAGFEQRLSGERVSASLPPWRAHLERVLPEWESGARSVWSLMQCNRRPEVRTAWPGHPAPRLDDVSQWPWLADDATGGR